ncbi:hypothetical protein ACFVW8_12365 [Streptomyces sp. NPDC058221]|uniref:hypothetical protein n=1 Tax=Streptomyces sp. NPDC058221 TaxID=3346388 RepID=UPI0036E344F1
MAAVSVYGWAHWCFAGPAAPPAGLAVAGGALLVAGTSAAYFALVSGSRGLFGALFLAAGLLACAAVADRATARGEVATCAVRDVRTEHLASYGEGGPPGATVYRLALRCPGGYPTLLKANRALAPVGGTVRVAYDREHRVSPAPEGGTSPWRPALWAATLLAAGTALARGGHTPDGPGPPDA